MLYYGGTALSYACVFGMRKGVLALLATGLASFNDRAGACTNSGLLPLHAIVAMDSPPPDGPPTSTGVPPPATAPW